MFNGTILTLNSDVNQYTSGKVTTHNTKESKEVISFPAGDHKATRNRQESIIKTKYET